MVSERVALVREWNWELIVGKCRGLYVQSGGHVRSLEGVCEIDALTGEDAGLGDVQRRHKPIDVGVVVPETPARSVH